MKYSLSLCIILLLCVSPSVFSQSEYNVIPLSKIIEHKQGNPFILNNKTGIIYPKGNNQLKQVAGFLSDYIYQSTGIRTSVSDIPKGINEILLTTGYNHTNKEAYSINISSDKIKINGASEDGVFYGVQTLRKALPLTNEVNPALSPATITDYPRFGNRGMMLDVARHFFPVSFLKKYIDILALHNINYLHLHLTNDQGWRVEIKKYPELTKTGAWRKETLIGKSTQYDGTPYGGYYTQDELRDLVNYATQQYITIVPEIDLPGHMLTALATYPELGCTGDPYEVWTKWGVSDDVLCMGNEETFRFLENVFTDKFIRGFEPLGCIQPFAGTFFPTAAVNDGKVAAIPLACGACFEQDMFRRSF